MNTELGLALMTDNNNLETTIILFKHILGGSIALGATMVTLFKSLIQISNLQLESSLISLQEVLNYNWTYDNIQLYLEKIAVHLKHMNRFIIIMEGFLNVLAYIFPESSLVVLKSKLSDVTDAYNLVADLVISWEVSEIIAANDPRLHHYR